MQAANPTLGLLQRHTYGGNQGYKSTIRIGRTQKKLLQAGNYALLLGIEGAAACACVRREGEKGVAGILFYGGKQTRAAIERQCIKRFRVDIMTFTYFSTYTTYVHPMHAQYFDSVLCTKRLDNTYWSHWPSPPQGSIFAAGASIARRSFAR